MYNNIENIEDIDRFLQSFVPEGAHPLLSGHLMTALRKPIRKETGFFCLASATSIRFDPTLVDARSRNTVARVCEWLALAIERQEPWMSITDKQGRPLRLLHIASLEDLEICMKKDVQRMCLQTQFSQATGLLRKKEDFGQIKIVQKITDGSHWVQLLTAEALDEESSMMGNCVGDGNYDSFLREPGAAILSLRDPLGRGHMTVQVQNGTMIQCRGKENAPPVEKYMQTIVDLIRKENWSLGTNLTLVCVILQDGKYYSLREIPPGFCYQGDFVLSDAKWLKEMPVKFSATGDVALIRCETIERIKEDIRSGKSVIVDGCKNLTAISGHLSAKGSITIGNNEKIKLITGRLSAECDVMVLGCEQLEYLSDNISASNTIRFKECPRLMHIGSQIYAGKDIAISMCQSLQSIGDNISVGGNLSIRNCRELLRVGENLHVENDLIIENCPNLSPLPCSTTVAGSISHNGRVYHSLEDFNAVLVDPCAAPPYRRSLGL